MSKSSKMLIESGIIPKSGLQQMEKWRVVEEGASESHGKHPVSLERDSEEALQFANQLAEELDKEDEEIRETDLSPAVQANVWIKWARAKEVEAVLGAVDALGRVILPATLFGNGQKRKIQEVAYQRPGRDESPCRPKAVVSTEPRYQGDIISEIVCNLEGDE